MILALETSCDETAVAVFDPQRGVSGEWLQSQVALHARHGGVVPDLAAREHLHNLAPLLEQVRTNGGFPRIRCVAVTRGPGLAACLAIGVGAAKAIALALGAPLVGVNHLRGHVWSVFLPIHGEAPDRFDARLAELLPHLGLVASGGHTLLCSMTDGRRISQLSSTRDDAAGEALDKGAKLLGLGYPGGPLIETLASGGRADAYAFPRGIARRSRLDFSFSGLKTSLRYLVEKLPVDVVREKSADLCASYQQAVVEALARKVRAALESGDFRSVGLSGGVGNNLRLRMAIEAEARRAGVRFLPARPQHLGDNAGMIAFAAWADPAAARAGAGMGLRIDPSLEVSAS